MVADAIPLGKLRRAVQLLGPVPIVIFQQPENHYGGDYWPTYLLFDGGIRVRAPEVPGSTVSLRVAAGIADDSKSGDGNTDLSYNEEPRADRYSSFNYPAGAGERFWSLS